MGVVSTITKDTLPKQGNLLGRKVNVCFQYDSSVTFPGTIIRNDAEEPGEILIQVEHPKGIIVLRDTECQYGFVKL